MAEMAACFRWLFFAAGPVEQAVTTKAMGWQVPEDRKGMAGFGSFDRTIDALDGWLSERDCIVGELFTIADIYVGSQVDWGLAFGTMPKRGSFEAYVERCRARDAYRTAKAIDEKPIGGMQDG